MGHQGPLTAWTGVSQVGREGWMTIPQWQDLNGGLDLLFKQNQAYQEETLMITTKGPVTDTCSVPGSQVGV